MTLPGSPFRTVALAVAALVAAAVTVASAEVPRVAAGRADESIRLDGVLDEEAWRRAGVIPDFVQQSPRPGEPTPYRTQVLLLVDDDTLYIGVRCFDPEPGKIVVHTLQRDGELYSDDHVTFVLDTFGDRRSGYIFRVNAAGARQDGLVDVAAGDGESYSGGGGEWDGIWDAAARVTADGWEGEIAIPSRTLRFARGADVWGFNIERTVPREHMDLRWTAITLDSTLSDLRRAGELAGVGRLHQGTGLSVSPYALVRSEQDLPADESTTEGDAGLDVAYALGPQLSVVATVNTDFAETEADTRQINLTRFSLFYPEKRQFFTDGANFFSFGAGLGETFVPFFSRRIGLHEGQRVPLLGGVKLVGRQGRWGIGVLDVQTKDSHGVAGTNLFASRLTYDLDDHLRLGLIGTFGDPDGVSHNRLGGVDAVWQTSQFRGNKNLRAGAWFAASGGDVPEGTRTGYGLELAYPNDLVSASLTFKELGTGLDPALGFLPRPGTRWYQAELSYNPRPRSGWLATWVQRLGFGLYPEIVTDLDGVTESRSFHVMLLNLETLSGDRIELAVSPQYELLTTPFEVSDGVVIPAGEHRFDRFEIEAGTSSHRPWQVETEVGFGEFYTGTLRQVELAVGYNSAGGHLQLSLEAEHAAGDLPEGDFVERLLRVRGAYSFSPALALSAFAQYDTDSRNVGVNTRLRWTVTPGTDLYVVWNHGWLHPEGAERWTELEPDLDQAIVKLRYTWRP